MKARLLSAVMKHGFQRTREEAGNKRENKRGKRKGEGEGTAVQYPAHMARCLSVGRPKKKRRKKKQVLPFLTKEAILRISASQ